MINKHKRITLFFNYFCAHPYIRAKVLSFRFHFFIKMRGIKCFESEGNKYLKPKLLSHNLSAFKNIAVDFSMRRMNMLINALTAVEKIHQDSKILIIGPRTENDIFILRGLGYMNLYGLDLISYSPLVKLGDMHNIPFCENTFDAVLCGWTISYSSNPLLAATEMIRVLKNGGLIAIGLEHVVFENQISKLREEYLVDLDDPHSRINTCKDIRDLFHSAELEVYFSHDAPLKNLPPSEIEKITGLASSQVMLVAGITKFDQQK